MGGILMWRGRVVACYIGLEPPFLLGISCGLGGSVRRSSSFLYAIVGT